MKKTNILIIASMVAVLASCAQDPDLSPDNQGATYYQIKANIAGNPEPETRTHMGALDGDTYPVYWSTDDQLALIENPDDASVFTIETGNGSTHATFGGLAERMVNPYVGTEIFPAAYPAEGAFAVPSSDSKLLVGSYLPHKQSYKSGTFADNVYPMAGMSQDGQDYDFHNLCGVIQLRIQATGDNQYIRQINLTGKNKEVIAGGIALKYDPATGEYETSSNTCDNGMAIEKYGPEEYTRIVIDFSGLKAGDTDAAGNVVTDKDGMAKLSSSAPLAFNIAVIPQTFEDGFTIEMVDGENFGSTFKEAAATTVKRSMVTVFSVIDYYPPKQLETANSYVYEEEGYYLMPAYAMGNRLDIKVIPEDFDDRANLEVDVLWSDIVDGSGNKLDAVTNIEYLTFEDGNDMLQFKVNKEPGTDHVYYGNVVLAVYDKRDKKIYWSWHLWLGTFHDVIIGGKCKSGAYDGHYPDGSDYHYVAESANGALVVMDRNLGARSADPADGWKTYGLLYQNGRKDPFPGADYEIGTLSTDTRKKYNDSYDAHVEEGDASSITVANSNAYSFTIGYAPKIWYNTELSSGWKFNSGFYNITQTIREPMIFSSGVFTNANGQWTNCQDEDNKTWMDPNLDNTGVNAHGQTGMRRTEHEAYWNRQKTIFDPCPSGYSVLGWEATYFGKEKPTKNTSYPYGLFTSYTYKGNSVTYNTWWPAAGIRTSSGQLADVGYAGLYFFTDHMEASHGGHGMYFVTSKTEIKSGITSNHAGSIRCVRAMQVGDLTANPLK